MPIKYKVVSKIKRKGYPTASKDYHKVHEDADYHEKKASPKEYKEMKNVDSKIKANELAGTHNVRGNIKVSKKVPPSLRDDVARHEFAEWKDDRRLCAKCKKSKRSHN
jgi:hypothetical protein